MVGFQAVVSVSWRARVKKRVDFIFFFFDLDLILGFEGLVR